jgi:hypothetical protein
MRIHPYSLWVALALPVAALGCAGDVRYPDAPKGVTNAQPRDPTSQDYGRAALLVADRQMKELAQLRDSSTDPFVTEAMTRQVEGLHLLSDKLLDDMTFGDARVHDAAIVVDVANLQRTIDTAANAEKQAEEPAADRPTTP